VAGCIDDKEAAVLEEVDDMREIEVRCPGLVKIGFAEGRFGKSLLGSLLGKVWQGELDCSCGWNKVGFKERVTSSQGS